LQRERRQQQNFNRREASCAPTRSGSQRGLRSLPTSAGLFSSAMVVGARNAEQPSTSSTITFSLSHWVEQRPLRICSCSALTATGERATCCNYRMPLPAAQNISTKALLDGCATASP